MCPGWRASPMRSGFCPAFVLWLVLPLGWSISRTEAVCAAEAGDRETFFETRIRPLFLQACIKCHGPDKARNGLRLDSRAAMVRGGDGGPSIIPGDPEASLLVRAVRYTDTQLRMPPTKRLADEAIAD